MINNKVKKWLIKTFEDFKKTHNLDFLLKLCIKKDKDFEKLNFGDLTSYAIEIRYPDEFYIPAIREAKESYKIVLNVKKFILNKLRIKENIFE